MIYNVQDIVVEVIRQAGKVPSADAVLRDVLKSIKGISPLDATAVAKTVFVYYRWYGWLRDESGVESGIRLALRLDER
ncbi:MAG: hypothetical protein EHM48_02115, partial [Planctomycetaceae bacterium]